MRIEAPTQRCTKVIKHQSVTPKNPPAEQHPLAGFDLLPDCALVDQPVVQALFVIKHATVWRHVKSGIIPAPVKVGRLARWRVGELRASLDSK